MRTVILTESLVKTFRSGGLSAPVLHDVSLQIEAGEFAVLRGPSGSGKSTLLNILGLIEAPTEGRFRFFDEEVSRADTKTKDRLRRLHVGTIFQGFNLIPTLSAVENVMLPLRIRRSKGAHREAMHRLEQVSMQSHAQKKPASLSGGQQQRVAIARAFVTRPTLILADEPTGNLDRENSTNVFALLEKLNREDGTTVIMATHERELPLNGYTSYHLVDGNVERKEMIGNVH